MTSFHVSRPVASTFLRRVPLLVAVVSTASAVGVGFLLAPILDGRLVFLPLAAAIAVSAYFGGLWFGLVATALGIVEASVFFVPPRFGPSGRPDDLVEFAVLAAIGIVISALGEKLHEAARREHALYERESAARHRIERLQHITAALSQAFSVEERAAAEVASATDALGAALIVASIDGTTGTLVGSSGLDEAELAPLRNLALRDSAAAIAVAMRTRRASYFRDDPVWRSEQASYGECLGARVFLPLLEDGRVIGGLALVYREACDFSAEDRAFLETVALQCAQALSRARTYAGEATARAEAEAANRVKDEFLAVLSHELRSPLNAIVGWTHVLGEMALPGPAERAVGIILRNAQHQTQLIADTLDLSRILSGKMRTEKAPVDLRGVLEQSLDTVRLAAEAKGVRLELRAEGSLGPLRGDADRLQQVFWNLLSNAVKFTSRGGSVEVAASTGGSAVTVSVHDSGAGISPEFLPHVFESFRQEDSSRARRHGGLGLGLAIVKHLVEAHGGTVQVDSAGHDQGATFTVRLPLFDTLGALERAPLEGPVPSVRREPALFGVHVLVVEDDADTRELLARTLSRTGADVVIVASAAEAYTQLRNGRTDVIVSDIGMPEEDGLAFIRRVRSHDALLPAVAVTAYAGPADRAEALAAGFQAHLAKPIDADTLAGTIASVLGRG